MFMSPIIMSFLPLNMVYLSEVEQRGDQSYEESIAVNLPLMISEKTSEASHVMNYKLVGDELMSTIGLYPNDSYLPEYQKILKEIPFYKRPKAMFNKLFENKDQTIWSYYFTDNHTFSYRLLDRETQKVKDYTIKLPNYVDNAYLDQYSVKDNKLTLYLRMSNQNNNKKPDDIMKFVIDITTGKQVSEDKLDGETYDKMTSISHTGNVFQPEYIVGQGEFDTKDKNPLDIRYNIYDTELNKVADFKYKANFKANAYQIYVVKDTIYILESDYNNQRDTLSVEDDNQEVQDHPKNRKYILSKLDKQFRQVKVSEFEGNISEVRLKEDKLMVLSTIDDQQIEAQLLSLDSGKEIYAIRWHLAAKNKTIEPLDINFVY